MLELERTSEQLEKFGLTHAAIVLPRWLEMGAQQNHAPLTVLSGLLEEELAARQDRYIKARTRLAHLPFHKTLADWNGRVSVDTSVRINCNLYGRYLDEPESQKSVQPGI